MIQSITEQKVLTTSKNHENEVVLSVDGVSKKFCRDLKRSLLYGVQDITSELLGLREKDDQLRLQEFWALKEVSFQLRQGEALGLIGKNGSGKSTLLRIITGLIKPDTGSVEVTGRVAPLIALGAGFNPVLTGRENIYANMSILGLSKKEINERLGAVIGFAEIGDAIDAPVHSYSSGMAARLGFASAIHTDPDILLIDEVLAVGDLMFRQKCYRQLSKLRERGTTFILVSHSPQSILSICDSAIYLKKGELITMGDASSVMSKYEADMFLSVTDDSPGFIRLPEKPVDQSIGIDILEIYFKDIENTVIASPHSGEPLFLCVKCKSHIEINDATLNVLIRDQHGEGDTILALSNDRDGQMLKLDSGVVEIQLYLPYCGLKVGSYIAKIYISRPPQYVYDIIESFKFNVKSNESMSQCAFYQPREWQIFNQKD